MAPKRSSANTLTDVSTAAAQVGISRQTLYNWIEKKVVTHQYDVGGRPVFTQQEMGQIGELASHRKDVLAQWRIPSSSSTER
jgi:predicted site-specific integrase-resolvase